MAIQFDYFFIYLFFFMLKRLNGKFNVRNFRRFLFGMSPYVPALKLVF